MNSTQTVDHIFLFIVAVSVALLLGVVVTMIWFVIKYDHRRHPRPESSKDSVLLEIIWVVVPLAIVLSMFFYGWKGFRFMRSAPPNALPVKAFGQMWTWSFEYPNGKTSGQLVVPVQKPVKLVITSRDVLHSLFIPAFRIKEDAVPGMTTHLWFLPDETGEYDLFCSEYCGKGHSSMITTVKVLAQNEFDSWYGEEAAPKKSSGLELLRAKGCFACHSIDGSAGVGPTLKGLYGHQVTVLTGGAERQITADEAYLRKSVLDPKADVVKGFPAIMPGEKDSLTAGELDAIIEYLKGLQ